MSNYLALLVMLLSANANSNPIIDSMGMGIETVTKMIGNADENTSTGQAVKAVSYGRCASSILSKDNIPLPQDDEAKKLGITDENLVAALDFFNKGAYAALYKSSKLSGEPIELFMAKSISSDWIQEAADSYTAFRSPSQLRKDRTDCIYYALILIATKDAFDEVFGG